MKKTLDSLSIRIGIGLDHKNTFENIMEVEIIIITSKMRLVMKRYILFEYLKLNRNGIVIVTDR
jgi:hypothetical protein